MADRYLIETSAVDGYLLEDGTGVLLIDQPTIVNNANTTATHQGADVFRVEKTAGGNAYNASAVSTTSYSADFALRITPNTYTNDALFGMNSDPLLDNDYASIDYAFNLVSLTNAVIYESGSTPLGGGTLHAIATYYWIWRSGTTLGYGTGATLATAQASPIRTVTTSATLSFDSSLFAQGTIVDVYVYPISGAQTFTVSVQGQTTPAPILSRLSGKALQSQSTPTPTLVRQSSKRLTITSTPVPTLVRQTGKARLVQSTPVPTLTKGLLFNKTVQGQSTPVATLVRQTAKLRQTQSTPVPTLVRQMTKTLQIQSTPAPTLVRLTSKSFQTQSTPVPSLTRARIYPKSLQGQSTPLPSLVRLIGKALQTSSTPSVTLYRAMVKTLQAQSTPIPTLVKGLQYNKTIQAQTTPVPTLVSSKTFVRILQASTGGVASGGVSGGVKVTAFFYRP